MELGTLSQSLSIRTFIGAKDYDTSKAFYRELGFEEIYLSPKMNLYKINQSISFYLQDYYSKEWIENSMVFLEVEDIDVSYQYISELRLPQNYSGVKLSGIVNEDWGKEFFLHDPSGVLWHFGIFH
jgi:catechol 2,3-dioxygenase-like lactoylglutathione lyase family enzyme